MLPLGAQVAFELDSYADLQRELRRLEISELDFYYGLRQKGIDPDRINLNDPQQLTQLEPVILELLTELQVDEPKTEANLSDTLELPIEEEILETDQLETEPEIEETPDSLRIYGHHYFQEDKISVFTSPSGIQPSEDYIVGPGDKLNVSLWGASRLDKLLEVKPNGYINLASPPIRTYVKGLSLAQVKEAVKKNLRQYYSFRDDEYSLSLSAARSIRVSVYGEVKRVGTISIPATNTALSALAAAGGPTELGSLREIKIVSGGEVSSFDFYKFLDNPEGQKEVYLQDDAIIQVPVSRIRVHALGAIRRQGFYDLKSSEDLRDLVGYAGGLSPDAYRSQIVISRIESNKRVQIDANVDRGVNLSLRNGDVVNVPVVPDITENTVEISGAVYKEGVYQLTRGMTVRELINKAGFTSGTRRDLAFMERLRPDGLLDYTKLSLVDLENSADGKIPLQGGDRLIIYGLDQFVDQGTFVIYGAVRDSGTFNIDQSRSLSISDAMTMAGGSTEKASGLIFVKRINTADNRKSDYIRLSFDQNDVVGDDIPILTGDSIYVEDGTLYYAGAFVEIDGEVNAPGRFDYDPSMTVQDLIYLASGFTEAAARNRVDIYRLLQEPNAPTRTISESVILTDGLNDDQNLELEPYDRIIVRSVEAYELQKMVEIRGEVAFPGPYGIIKDNQRISDLIKMAGGLTPEAFPAAATLERLEDSVGFVVMRLDDVMEKSKTRFDYYLKEGDVITIPKKKNLVSISGAVNATELYPSKFINPGNSIKVPHHQAKTAKFYLNEYAAGVSSVADKKLITVEHANGQIQSVKKVLFFRTYPPVYEGSHIKVGYKKPDPPKEERQKDPVNWGEVVGQTLAQATAVLSLILLARELRSE